jgi:hypothetical protein
MGMSGGGHEGFLVGSGSGMEVVQPCVALLGVLVGAAFSLGSSASWIDTDVEKCGKVKKTRLKKRRRSTPAD